MYERRGPIIYYISSSATPTWGTEAQLVDSRGGVARRQVGEVMVHPVTKTKFFFVDNNDNNNNDSIENLDLLAARLASSPPRAALSASKLKPPRSRASGQDSITGTTLVVSLPTLWVKPTSVFKSSLFSLHLCLLPSLEAPEYNLDMLKISFNDSGLLLQAKQLLVLLLLHVLQELPQQLFLREDALSGKLLPPRLKQPQHQLHVRQGHCLPSRARQCCAQGGQVWVGEGIGGPELMLS